MSRAEREQRNIYIMKAYKAVHLLLMALAFVIVYLKFYGAGFDSFNSRLLNLLLYMMLIFSTEKVIRYLQVNQEKSVSILQTVHHADSLRVIIMMRKQRRHAGTMAGTIPETLHGRMKTASTGM